MGAFGEFFGFDGRIGRLGYLWRSLAAGVCIVILGFVGGILLARFVRPGGEADSVLGAQAIMVAVVLLALWAGTAIASRRLRDMGMEPAHIVPLYAALWVVNVVLLEPLSRQQPETFGALEAGWVILQLLAAIPLLFWPSSHAVRPQAIFERPEPTTYLNWREGG